MVKADYLRDCMSTFGTVPIDQFNLAFCVVCTNAECTRSRANTMGFTKRVQTWEDTMFNKVPRAADDDPQFAGHRAKNFLPVIGENMAEPQVERAPEINFVVNKPVDISSLVIPSIGMPQGKAPEVSPSLLSGSPAPAPPLDAAKELPAKPEKAPGASNTQFAQGTILKKPGAEETVIPSGGTYTFGSDE